MTFEDWWAGQAIPSNIPNYVWFKTLANYAYAAGGDGRDTVRRCPACGRDLGNLMVHECPHGTPEPLHISTLAYEETHQDIDRIRDAVRR